MKKILVLLTAVASIAVFNACKKKVEVTFPPFTTGTITALIDIPVSGATLETTASGKVSVNLDSIIKANTGGKMSVSNIKTLFVTELANLTLENADQTNNFSNVEELSATISSNVKPASEPFISKITETSALYDKVDALPYINQALNLVDYVSKDGNTEITYNVSGKLKTPTTKPLIMRVDVKFKVEAGTK
jgi:hypothetical protein